VTDDPAHDAPDLMAQTDLAALSADAANWRTLLAELTARGYEYMSLEAILFNFATTEELAPLSANLLETGNEATNWHTLLFALNARGFENMTLQNIIDVFPDFRTLAHEKDHADPPRSLQAARDEFLAAARNVNASFMPDPIPPRTQKRPATIQHTQPVDVREFAEANTRLGTVTVGFTDDGQLTFTFSVSQNVYLLPITNVLNDLMLVVNERETAAQQRILSGSKIPRDIDGKTYATTPENKKPTRLM
jgi:hypothetical protein